MSDEKPNWKICMENAKKVAGYVFGSGPSQAKLKTKNCARCSGTGYKKQSPGEYGLCECPSCGGSGKVVSSGI